MNKHSPGSRKASSLLCALVILLSLPILSASLLAQPVPSKLPGSTHIFPAGGKIGSTVKVRVGAECIPPGTRFHLSDPRLSAPPLLKTRSLVRGEKSPRRIPTEIPITYPKEWLSQLTIPAEVGPGVVYWKISCAAGGTAWRPFVLGTLPEFLENESNSTLQTAQEVPTPVTINGQIYGERDVDYYRFSLNTDQLIVCEVLAGRIGSSLDPIVEFLDATGKKLPTAICHIGSDPVLALKAPESGNYFLRVANISYHGSASHVYRLNLTHQPMVQAAFPQGGKQGTSQEVQFLLLDGSSQGTLVKQRVTFPELTDTTATSFQFQPNKQWQATTLSVNRHTNQSEQEPNDRDQQAMPIALGHAIHGQFASETDQDWFRLATEKGNHYTITCEAVAPLYQANPIITLFDPSGKKLKEVHSVETSGHTKFTWKATKDEDLLLRIRDLRFGALGGFSLVYQLHVASAVPDFQLHIPSQHLQVQQGGKATVDLEVTRSGELLGPIKITAGKLPAGVTLESLEIPANKLKGKLVFVATDDAVATSQAIHITGVATSGETVVERKARIGHLGVDPEGRSVGSATLEQIPLTVLHKPIFRLYCAEAYLYAHRGSVFPYLMEIERQAGFQGKITLQIGDRQNRDLDGIEMHEVEIPAESTQTMLPIYLPETMHINIQSQSQLYCQGYATFTDQHGQQQTFLAVSEKRNMLRTLPPVVKLKAIDEQFSCPSGARVRCRLKLQRTSNFLGPMLLTLTGDRTRTDCSLEPLTIGAGQTEIQFDLQMGQLTGTRQLTFRATGQMAGQTVISETTVSVTVNEQQP
jgi:hypothetical protein